MFLQNVVDCNDEIGSWFQNELIYRMLEPRAHPRFKTLHRMFMYVVRRT